MDYKKANKINVDGNGNIIIQDLNNTTITINSDDTAKFTHLLAEANESLLSQLKNLLTNENLKQDFETIYIKFEKDKLYSKIAELEQLVCLMQSDKDHCEDTEANIEMFKNIHFDDLILSIKNDNCVLFIGPEISTENGNSLHENFYKSIHGESLVYNPDEGLFLPGSITALINQTKRFYSETFPALNISGKKILKKLAQIPFKLFISFCPDNSLSDILTKHNIRHFSIDYNGTEISTENINWNEPLIFNALGNAINESRYIFTHKQINNYIKAAPAQRIPRDIEAKIQKATNYIFIGFNFDKWYYRLLMFSFKFDETECLSFGVKDNTRKIYKDFMKRQFGINFIDTDYDDFASLLLQKSKDAGLSKSLDQLYVKTILKELEQVRLKSFDSQKLEELIALEKSLDAIENKINQQEL